MSKIPINLYQLTHPIRPPPTHLTIRKEPSYTIPFKRAPFLLGQLVKVLLLSHIRIRIQNDFYFSCSLPTSSLMRLSAQNPQSHVYKTSHHALVLLILPTNPG